MFILNFLLCGISKTSYVIHSTAKTTVIHAIKSIKKLQFYFILFCLVLREVGSWYYALYAGRCTAQFCNNITEIAFQCISWTCHRASRNAEWPPRSPDLILLDFFLWRFLIEKVYARKPRDGNSLGAIIRQEFGRVPNEIHVRAVQNVEPRLGNCAANAGVYIEF